MVTSSCPASTGRFASLLCAGNECEEYAEMEKHLSNFFISLVRVACGKAFWYKKSLASFLRQYHIAEGYISPLFQGKTKAEVLADIFDRLACNQTTKSQAIILDMAKDLSSMKSFPDLELHEDSKKLISEANRATAALREQYEKLEASYVDTGDEETRRKARERRNASVSYEEQFKTFSDRLNKIAANAGQQEAGYDFEQWIYDFFVFNDIDARKPFKGIDGRQVDGAITLNGDTMLVEAKCTAQKTTVTDIDSFHVKIETKADNTLGLMISMVGYDNSAIAAASHGRTPFILIDGGHLFNLVMTRRLTFAELIERVKRHAAQTGSPYLPLKDF